MPKQPHNPHTLPRPSGFSHAWSTSGGRTVYVAGQVATDRAGQVVGTGDLVAQFRQVCENLRHAVGAAGGALTDVVKLNLYVLSKAEYKAKAREIGGVYREYFGRHYPAMTLVEVRSLFDDACAIEIEAIAVVE